MRIGTAAVTTAGMDVPEMVEIAHLIARALRERDDETALDAVREQVGVLCAKHTPYPA